MKKIGFTLAEVLITLGIIGVIAALTMPALVKNTGDQKIGPTLAKFVNTFENAAQQAMLDQGETDLIDIAGFTATGGLLKKLSKYIIMTDLDDGKHGGYTYYSPDGSNSKTSNKGVYQLKDGGIIAGENSSPLLNKSSEGVYKKVIGRIIYDIDGPSGDNRAGYDVYAFDVDNSGLLIPVGSKTTKELNSKYTNTCSYTSSTVEDGLACTGVIADNGWKVK